MKNKLIRILTISLLIGPFLAMTLNAEGKSKNTLKELLKGENRSKTYFTINQISTPVINNGSTDREGGNSGLVYPKGGTKTAVFQSGFFFGGIQNGVKKVGGSMYDSGLLVGPINPDGTPNKTDAQSIYRVRPDWQSGDLSAEAKVAAGLNVDDIRKIYKEDWNNWPAQFGAPYKDVDKDGKYNPAVDIPGYPGADQTIWFVANDADSKTAGQFLNTVPLGVEIQTTIWGYNTNTALGYMLFRRYRIINKSKSDINDMYLAMWSDVDLGGAGDDLIGVDTELNLGFCYNGTAVDEQYGRTPPAVGFDFFQGPIVDGNAGDVAIFDNKKIPGKKNLGLENFFYFINNEPNLGDPQNVKEAYFLLQGLKPGGDPYTEFSTGKVTTHPFSGDPVLGTGDLDANEFQPGDRRFGQSSGPFKFKVGDVQEIVVAEIVAGDIEGVDNISAVGLLKFYDKFAQTAYDNFFKIPKPPVAPKVAVTELDQEIVLNWSVVDTLIKKIETHNNGGYLFEGYNVYQLPQSIFSKIGAKRVATFDLNNRVGKIKDDLFDPTQGVVNKKVVQFGRDGGLQRTIKIDKDLFDNSPLYNGANYYFAVTAYAVNPNPKAVPRTLESEIIPIHVVPHTLNPGIVVKHDEGQSLILTHSKGSADAKVKALVVDPLKVKNGNYKVSFFQKAINDTTTHYFWKLLKNNQTVKDSIAIFSGKDINAEKNAKVNEAASPVTDGIRFMVEGDFKNPVDFSEYSLISDGKDIGTKAPYKVLGNYKVSSYFTHGWAKNNSTAKNILGKGASGSVLLDDYEIRWTGEIEYAADSLARVKAGTGSIARIYGAGNYTLDKHPLNPNPGVKKSFNVRVPFEVWNTRTNKQISILIYDRVQSATARPFYAWNPKGRMYTFIHNAPYSENGFDENDTTQAKFLTWNHVWWESDWKKGDVIKIKYANPIVADSDEFSITTTGVGYNAEVAKNKVDEINVFPNPYYGVNSEEVNKYQRYVTFSHLPQRANIRIFNLAGQPIRYIEKDNSSQFLQWDLTNQNELPVASGIYIAYIEMPDLGKTKILKVAIIQEQQFLDRF